MLASAISIQLLIAAEDINKKKDLCYNLKSLIFIISDQSNSTYSTILLENIDSDIPIALNFTTPTKVTQAKDNQAANKLSTKKSSSIISGTERYLDEKYVAKNLNQELLC